MTSTADQKHSDRARYSKEVGIMLKKKLIALLLEVPHWGLIFGAKKQPYTEI